MTHDQETVERVAMAMWNEDAPQRMHLEPEAIDSDLARKYWRLARAAISAMPPREVSVQEAAKVLLDHLPNPIFDLLKPHMLSEFSQAFPYTDENGDEVFSQVNISWVTQKQIIRHALRTLYAELTGGKDGT